MIASRITAVGAFVALAGSALHLVGCGGATPPPAPVEHQQESVAPRKTGPKMQMQSELGEIDPKAVEATMQRVQGKVLECHRSGLKRIEYLGGDVKFFLRIGQDGRIKYGYFEESTLGDDETEKCIMQALEGAAWPKPEGGEAEVRKSFGLDAPGDVRAPTSWPADKVVQALGKAEDDVKKCRSGVSGSFKATAYVEPEGKFGKLQAVGIAPPSKEGADKVDCLVKTLKGLKVPSPGSYAAKVTFIL